MVQTHCCQLKRSEKQSSVGVGWRWQVVWGLNGLGVHMYDVREKRPTSSSSSSTRDKRWSLLRIYLVVTIKHNTQKLTQAARAVPPSFSHDHHTTTTIIIIFFFFFFFKMSVLFFRRKVEN
jgi:hypothetical protein